MILPKKFSAIVALAAVMSLTGCRATAPQPGAEAPESGQATSDAGMDPGNQDYTDADVRFVQGMISHHAQAVRMSSLVPTRSSNESLSVLSRRIGISQLTEIDLMERWLRKNDQTAPQPALEYPPDEHSHSVHMPGMLTSDEMARLAAAEGTGFDRLFLNGMITHHLGALTMVENLFDTPGAAQNAAIFQLATDISGVQRSQIARMRALLSQLPDAPDQ